MEEQVELLLEKLSEFLQEHWLKALGALALTLFTGFWGFLVAWRKWKTRQDLDVIHYSQNTIQQRPTGPKGEPERWLILDVYAENSLSEEITHPIPRRLIRKAAKRTTVEQPFLYFDEDDRWQLLNLVRLAIAEQFRHGAVAKLSKRAQVDEVECIFALTYERYKKMRQGKIRVMVVPKELLDRPETLDGELRFESPTHVDRVTTLKRMRDDYRRGLANMQYCMDVRISIPL